VQVAACGLWLCSARANRQANIPSFYYPVQNYAVIDITGSTNGNNVSVVELNDQNQAAFG
jgi:hypothetical protein